MTFVAQPYERFVDDLLMALTGGTIREEHEFTGIDRAYSLGRPDAVAESLQAFGQRDGEFAVFEQGVDYRYDPVEDALAWHLDGRPPDDRTTFYVSYFTEDATSRLTDRNPGSVTTTLSEAFGRQYAVLHKEMELIYESAFVDLASGSALEHVAALLDVTRKDARFASGEVLLRRSTPAPGDIAIAVGTLVSTPEGQVFEATAPRTLRRDQLSAVVPVRAQVEGPAGAVAPGAITIVNRPIFGIEGVLNERATFFAAERETDEELRRRIRGRIHRAGRSTLDAIRTSLIDGVPDVTEANVQVTEHADSPGYVEVRLGVTGEGDENFVRSVDDAILAARPAGVRVRHNLSAPGPAIAVPPAAPAADGIPRDEVVADLRSAGGPEPAATVPGSADGAATVLPIRVEILLRLVEANLTATEREAVESTVRTAVMGYVEALAMGAPLVHAKLLGLAVAPEEVADASMVVIALTAEGEQPSYRVNVVAEGRKLTARPHDVAIYLMDQPVRLDVRVLVEGDGEVTGPVNAAARAAVERVAGESRTIARDAVRTAVAEALADLGLGPVEHDAVVVNAMYEETGRVLSDAAEIALADHEVPTVGTVEVAKLGVLDG